MAESLLDLRPHLIDRILSYNESTHLSLPLWLIGNRRLHALLSDSVTFVELQNHRRLDYVRLPKYLMNLGSLRHLLVDRIWFRGYGAVYDLERTKEVLTGLSKSLESLMLRFTNSHAFFFPAAPEFTPRISIEATFPELTRLQLDLCTVWTSKQLTILPNSLTELHVCIDSTDMNSSLGALPSQITRLVLRLASSTRTLALSPSFFEQIPPHTRELIVYSNAPRVEFNAKYLAKMPQSLTAIAQRDLIGFSPPLGVGSIAEIQENTLPNECIIHWTPDCGPLVPPYLAHIHIPDLPKQDCAQALAALPKDLKSIVCRAPPMKPKLLHALPQSLISMNVSFHAASKFKLTDFPPKLKSLAISSYQVTDRFIASLPPLTRFTVFSRIPMKYMDLLPRTITILHVSFLDFENNVDFPPNISQFTCYSSILTLYEYPEDDKDPKGRKKLKKKMMEEKQAHPQLAAPPACRLFQCFPVMCLPRNLQHFYAPTGRIAASRLIHLPPNLRQLTLHSIIFDAEFKPTDESMILAARHMLEEARETSFYDFRISPSEEPQVTIFDLLPRSLTVLTLERAPKMGPLAYGRLPKGITTLELVTPGGEEADALLHIPSIQLRNLLFLADRIYDRHLKAVQHVPFLELQVTRSIELTTPAIASMRPSNLEDRFWISRGGPAHEKMWNDYLQEAIVATQDASGKTLLALKDRVLGESSDQ